MISNWFQSTFQSLSNRHYRTLWTGTPVAFLAFMMSGIVQSIVAFDADGKIEKSLSWPSVWAWPPSTISPFGGVIADRVSKRKLVLIGQCIIGVNFLTVGILIVTDSITILALTASTFVIRGPSRLHRPRSSGVDGRRNRWPG